MSSKELKTDDNSSTGNTCASIEPESTDNSNLHVHVFTSTASVGDKEADSQKPIVVSSDVDINQGSTTEYQSTQNKGTDSEVMCELQTESNGEGFGSQEEKYDAVIESQRPINEQILPTDASKMTEDSCSTDTVQTCTIIGNRTDAGKLTDVVLMNTEPSSKDPNDISNDVPTSEGAVDEKAEISAADCGATSISLSPDGGIDPAPGVDESSVAAGSPSASAASALQGSATDLEKQSLYKIKTIKWKETSVPSITQNENGPCPLIALINVLLLKSKVNPFGSKVEITPDDLMSYLGDCILFNAPKNISNGAQLDYEQNVQDAFSVFPKLQTGLDVNVKFTGVHDFEYTTECIIFDLLNIPLYHGWLVDPQAKEVVAAVSKLSYNQLVEKIITNKNSTDNDLVTEALVAENFLERSASQLTYHGLYELNAVMKPDELAVLFRNNHFITIHKHKNELFQLVTDLGFLHENNVIWETLSNIEGDGLFVDSNFVTVPPKPAPPVVIGPNENLNQEEQIQQDYLVALSLQEEQKREEEKEMVWQEYKEKELGATAEMTDEELARRLQAEERKQAESQVECAADGNQSNSSAASRQHLSEGAAGRPPQKKKERDCCIL